LIVEDIFAQHYELGLLGRNKKKSHARVNSMNTMAMNSPF
jgi:hypothetical protein